MPDCAASIRAPVKRDLLRVGATLSWNLLKSFTVICLTRLGSACMYCQLTAVACWAGHSVRALHVPVCRSWLTCSDYNWLAYKEDLEGVAILGLPVSVRLVDLFLANHFEVS